MSLEQYITKKLEEARTNRNIVADKWDWCDQLVDGKVLPWKEDHGQPGEGADGKRSYKSKLRYPLAAQRATSAESLATDALFPSNEVPLEFDRDDPDGAGPEEAAETLQVYRDLRDMLEECEAVSELLEVYKEACRYGDGFGSFYLDGDAWGIEHVPARECFPDWRRRDIGRGEYFFRVQERSRADALEMFEGISFVQQDKLRDAIAKGQGTPHLTVGDGREELPAGKPEVEVVEAWLKVSLQKLAEYVTANEKQIEEGLSGLIDGAEEWENLVPVLAWLVNGVLVGVLPGPGPCPYERFVWRTWPRRVDGRGLVEDLAEMQDALTGIVRSLDNGAKIASGMLLAMDDSIAVDFVDARDAVAQGKVVKVGAGMDVQKLIQAIQPTVTLQPILETLRTYIELADHISPVQLSQGGQGTPKHQTFSEFQLRLENAGKYILGVVRNFARFAGRLLNGIWTEMYELLPPEEQAELAHSRVRVTFEASYIRKMELQKAAMLVMNLAERNEEIKKRMNWTAIFDLVLQGTTIKAEEVLMKDDDPRIAQREEMERLAAEVQQNRDEAERLRAEAQAKELEARAILNQARADRELATSEVLEASIETDAEKLKVDKARTASQIRQAVHQQRRDQQQAAPADTSVPEVSIPLQPDSGAAPVEVGPSVPEPGRAAMLPGGEI